MHGKGEFAKIKDSICNIPIEAANVCNICNIMFILNQYAQMSYTRH